MIPAARVAAAIEVLEDVEARRRPVADALKDWGLSHRFAGSKDRAAIADLVFDALRLRASARWIMGAESARATMLGALTRARGLGVEAIAALFSGEGHAPAALTEAERARLAAASLEGAPDHVAGDYPEWLAPAFAAAYGEAAVAEGQALARRAPVDLRVNTLKTTREKALAALAHLGVAPTSLSPVGLRIALAAEQRAPALAAEPAYVKGQIEIQDEGSQLAALLAGARAGDQVLDLCAGGGGKTLALAAQMENRGQIYATDSDGRRLTPIYARLERAGARNVQVRAPKGRASAIGDLAQRCDVVLVDAPCTGTGAWRRNPDAKWRVRPGALEQRIADQDRVLGEAAACVKPGGLVLYVTCSVLIEENEARVAAFLSTHPGFSALDATALCRRAALPELARFASRHGPGLRLSPATSGTDGFFVAALARA
ncbi:MAG: RsmB/NOP family class I SAM-dependent RNA methyltransferase [Methylobacteriaceae bacterium]|nr:RsmB/NOP family class I SAM-dependent RNA methyltransferase [Methylobacteriaceae bacterium]